MNTPLMIDNWCYGIPFVFENSCKILRIERMFLLILHIIGVDASLQQMNINFGTTFRNDKQ